MRIFTDASTSGQVSGIAFIVTDKHHNVLIKKSKPLIESDNNFAESIISFDDVFLFSVMDRGMGFRN